MNIKFVGVFLLAAALLMPAFSSAADTSTDTTGEYLDDATITTKVKAVKAVHNNLKINPN